MRFDPLDVFTCPLAGVRRIEASAGTGKTWNICGLYLRLLLERGIDVQHILVVTFTNAATAELRERIRQRIVDTLAFVRPEDGAPLSTGDDFVERLVGTLRATQGLDDDTLATRLELALATFDEASIFTIHGFCQRALADTPFTAQMPLALELVQDASPWVAQAATDFWRRRVDTDDLDPALADLLVERRDSPDYFARLLKRHLAKPLARAEWPEGIDADVRPDARALAAAHVAAQRAWHDRREEIIDLVSRACTKDLSKAVYKDDALRAAIAAWDALLAGPDPALAQVPEGAKPELFGAAKLAAATKKNCTTPRHAFFELADKLLEQRRAVDEAVAIRRLGLLRALLDEGAAEQREAKRRQRVVAFDDMLSNLHDRLAGADAPWLAAALRARFPAALIDEFQDTDPLQFAIFKSIYTGTGAAAAEAPPVFFVGDPKQAIYSFRNADLHTYLAAGREAMAHYSLVENQRSTGPLIEALNGLFGANPRAFMLDELAYQPVKLGAKPRKPLVDRSTGTEAQKGSGLRPHPSIGAALQAWMLPLDEATGEPLRQRAAQAAVVEATAGEISRLLGAAQRGEITLGEGSSTRPLAAGDIAVLVRNNAQGSLIRHALGALGIGSVELSRTSVFASSDAEELERVLAAVLTPAHEQRLKAALATEAMGWDAAAIDGIARDESALLAQVQRFAGWRDTWLQRGIGFMLRQWMAAADVTARLLARADGERRLTNLLHLIECLHEAAQAHAAPDTLLRWLQAQRAGGPAAAEEATQLRLESDRNLVQIVTIHKSKGLEYPIVFCPFLWGPETAPPSEDGADSAVYHDDDGELVIDWRKRFFDKDTDADVKRRLKLARAQETLRLIYVALTRGVHRCVIVAGCCLSQFGNNLTPNPSARSLLNWLVAGAGMTPDEWFKHEGGVPAIADAWWELAQSSHGTIAVLPLPLAPPEPLTTPRPAPESLAALAPPHPMPSAWWMGSFSSIAHGAVQEQSALDHDLRILADAAAAAPAPAPRLADDDILRFPRGPAAGECMHDVFERIDFTAPAGWPPAIAAALRLLRTMNAAKTRDEGNASADVDTDAAHVSMLRSMLADVLATPLPLGTAHPLRLSELPRSRRLVELEFHLPTHRLDATTLNEALAREGIDLPRLGFATLRGYLKGFIDLVFEHEGRYFVLDWKSNHLGDTPAAYERGPLASAMREQTYHLQYLLYLVALDRYLRTRLAGYDPDRHLGGAVYLFVRGVRPSWRDEDGTPCGVFFHRPAAATIRRLSALFDEAEVLS